MRVLVTGANGQLGQSIRSVYKETDDTYLFTDICGDYEKLDITDIDAVRTYVHRNEIDTIINCAAYTNVDAAEANKELAEMLNAKAPENLAVVMKEVNGWLVHISTDYVFGKEPYNTPCTEEMQGTPTGIYGQTKLQGERNIQAVDGNYIIIRTSWLYSEYGNNFCKTILRLLKEKTQIKVVFDQVGTPTYAVDLAKEIVWILDGLKMEKGIYNFSNEGVCSWYDFAMMIQTFAKGTTCDIIPCHSDEFPSPVVRPSYSVLDKTKIKETFGLTIPYWMASLYECMKQMDCIKQME